MGVEATVRRPSRREARVIWLLEAALSQARRLTGNEELCRVSIAVYDGATGTVSAFAQVGGAHPVLDRYQWTLREVPHLAAIAHDGQARAIEDLRATVDPDPDYVGALCGAGFLSALTVPMIKADHLSGFVFFHARTTGFFSPALVGRLGAFIADMPRFLMRELERDL